MTKNVILGILFVITLALGATAFCQGQQHKRMALIAQARAMENSKLAEADAQRLTAISDSLTLALKECQERAEE